MSLRMMTAGPGARWEAALVQACRRPHARAEVIQRCYDLPELLALAATGTAQVALVDVDEGLRRLDRDAVAALARAGVGVVAVTGSHDRHARGRLRQLGVVHVASDEDGPDQLLALAEAAATAAGTAVPGRVTPGAVTLGPRHPRPAGTVDRPSGHGLASAGLPGGDPALAGSPGAGSPGGDRARPDPGRDGGLAAGQGGWRGGGWQGGGAAGDVGAALGAAGAALDGAGDGDPGRERRRRDGVPPDGRQPGQVIAVWGPKGAPGRTTVAVNLAVEAARLGLDTLLADADTYGGSVAQLLGLLDGCPGLAWAARLSARGELDAARLRRDTYRIAADGPRVLVGLPRSELWTELSPAVWDHLLATFRDAFPLTVLDLGFCLEEDEELLYDQVRLRRNVVARASLRQADAVVAVTRADPLGLHDFIHGFRALQDLGAGADRVHVVVNQLRGGLVGGDPTTQIRAVLARYLGIEPAAFIPYDRAAIDAATLAARALAEASPGSPARQALAELARSILGVPGKPARRRAWPRARRGAARRQGHARPAATTPAPAPAQAPAAPPAPAAPGMAMER